MNYQIEICSSNLTCVQGMNTQLEIHLTDLSLRLCDDMIWAEHYNEMKEHCAAAGVMVPVITYD